MLKIYCSDKNLPEKKYIFDITFNEFLGVEYELIISNEEKNYLILLPNQKKIIIEDYFWNKIKGDELSYLNYDFLPSKVDYIRSQYTFEEDLPIIYGKPEIRRETDKILCSVDIFSTIYFFLSRWEEYISTDRDFAERFKYENSISSKFNLLHRPVVNELTELLWNMLIDMGYTGEKKGHTFTPVITHDIDQPVRLSSFKMLIKASGKSILRYKNYSEVLKLTAVYLLNKITPAYDPANSYDFLMDVSDSIGVKSYFNFQSSAKTDYDWGYSINSNFIVKLFQNIKNRDHIIGFHPGFYTLDNPTIWKEQYDKLCNASETQVLSGRQHYLRFKVPYTWQIWEDNGLKFDSTLGYAEKEGFRCGTCYSYSIYNFLTRKQLKLKEMPLLLMDVSLMGYQNNINTEQFLHKFNSLADIVRKYGGNFVFLWHNSAFDSSIFTKRFYKNLISGLRK